MSELPITDGHGALLQTAFLNILSIMYFPKDDDSCLSFARAALAQGLWEEGSEEDGMRATLAGLMGHSRYWWGLLGDRNKLEGLDAAARRAALQGETAGELLLTALCIGKAMPRFASLNNAVRIVCRRQRRSPSLVNGDWRGFKPVANLYAAMALLRVHQIETMADLAAGDDEALIALLAVSERLRLMAASQVSKQNSKKGEPLVSDGAAIPADLHIELADITLPTLPDWMVAEIVN